MVIRCHFGSNDYFSPIVIDANLESIDLPDNGITPIKKFVRCPGYIFAKGAEEEKFVQIITRRGTPASIFGCDIEQTQAK